MKKSSMKNVRIIHEFTKYLRDAKGQNHSTIDGSLKSINRFEEHTGYLDFDKFKAKHAIGFKKDIL